MDPLIPVLKLDYQKRTERNPGYSLRAYARWLGLNPTSVSLFFNGKRGLSRRTKEKVVERLALSPEVAETFLGSSGSSSPRFERLDLEKLTIISDWYYFAVLSLMETKTFKSDPVWIAKRLGITISQAAGALKKLEALGLVSRTARGKYVSTGAWFETPPAVSTLALRRTHYQGLELAKTSLDSDALADRDFSAMTMAIDPARLPEAKRRIKRFRRSLCAYLEGGEKKEVYRLAVLLFALSKP